MSQSFLKDQLKRLQDMTEQMARVHTHATELSQELERADETHLFVAELRRAQSPGRTSSRGGRAERPSTCCARFPAAPPSLVTRHATP
jgi:hypothetical protein